MRKLVVASSLVLAFTRTAHAIPYETFIDVDDESDLQDLLSAQDITQDTYDELLDLLDSGVDLNTADRATLYTLPNLTYEDVDKIIAFRDLQKGVIKDPAALATAGVLSQEKLLAIAAFLSTRDPSDNPLLVHGSIRLATRWEVHDTHAPPTQLRVRLTALKHLTIGLDGVMTRLQVGDPHYDATRETLVADQRGLQLHVPKAYAKWEDDHVTAIIGSFRAGFAQRLVFDNTRHYTPNGLYADDQIYYTSDLTLSCKESAGELATSPCAGDAAGKYVTPDWNWREGMFGVGAGIKKLELDQGWLQGYAWASMARRSIYQYELVDRANCKDPHDDRDPACAAPPVLVDDGSLDPTAAYAFTTLPDVFLEKMVGGNVTYFNDRRNSVGLTAYGATETNLVSGVDLDFQEWSRFPTGRTFMAGGANFTLGRGAYDLGGEVAYNVDKLPAKDSLATSGGPAAILRLTRTKKREELEIVARYYSTDYVNPYGRPISEPDEYDGQRARDELGVRARYIKTSKEWTLRALMDFWVPPSSFKDDPIVNPAGHVTPKIDTYVRGDVRTTDQVRLGLWLRYQDKDLSHGGHDQCFEVTYEQTDTGAPVPCFGRQLTTIVRGQFLDRHAFTATVMLEHQLLDDRSLSKTAFRQDIAAWAIALWSPMPGVRIRGRVRYLNEAIERSDYLESSVSALLDAAFTLRTRDLLRVRLDSKFWIDDRTSTQDRDPNPELQLWLSYEAKL